VPSNRYGAPAELWFYTASRSLFVCKRSASEENHGEMIKRADRPEINRAMNGGFFLPRRV
jgi:hypothetical protein